MKYQCSNKHRFEDKTSPARCAAAGCASRILRPVADGHSPRTHASDSIARWFAVTFWIGLVGLFVSGMISASEDVDDSSVAGIPLLAMTILAASQICFFVGLYRGWRLVQTANTSAPSAGMAVGLLFVPLFNLYWVFKAIGGLPRSLKALADAHHLDLRNVHPTLAQATCIGWLYIGVAPFFPLDENSPFAVLNGALVISAMLVQYMFARQMFAASAQLGRSV